MLLVAFYGLCLTLLVLLLRPRLVIYNVNPDQLRAVLAEVVAELDADARWAGDSLVLPKLGVQLHVELSRGMRNVQLVAAGHRQNYAGWKRLEIALAKVLHQTTGSPNPAGFGMIAAGVLLICLLDLSHGQRSGDGRAADSTTCCGGERCAAESLASVEQQSSNRLRRRGVTRLEWTVADVAIPWPASTVRMTVRDRFVGWVARLGERRVAVGCGRSSRELFADPACFRHRRPAAATRIRLPGESSSYTTRKLTVATVSSSPGGTSALVTR